MSFAQQNNGNYAAQSQEKQAFIVMKQRLLFLLLPICKAGKWCVELVNGAQSHVNSSKIVYFRDVISLLAKEREQS